MLCGKVGNYFVYMLYVADGFGVSLGDGSVLRPMSVKTLSVHLDQTGRLASLHVPRTGHAPLFFNPYARYVVLDERFAVQFGWLGSGTFDLRAFVSRFCVHFNRGWPAAE